MKNINNDSTKIHSKDTTNKKISGIYKIINKVNGKYYVGSSINIMEPNVGRWYSHKHMLSRKSHHNNKLQNAWNKYGENNFEFILLEECRVDILIETEQKYLDMANLEKHKSYNLTFTAYKIDMTNEIKKKISLSNKRRLEDKTKHPMYGKRHSEETKRLIAINSVKRGKENGMFGVRRFGKDSPNFGNGDKQRGKLNPKYNNTIYNFFNIITNETFTGTCFDFKSKFKLSTVYDLIHKRIKKTISGWTVVF